MSKVQVGAAINASFGYILVAWRKAGGIMATLVLTSLAFGLADVFEPHASWIGFVRLLVLTAVATMSIGALYRIGIEASHAGDPAYAPGPGGFQWSALEWRVLGANLVFGLVLAVPLVVMLVLWGIGLGATLAGHGDLLQRMQTGSDAQRLQALAQLMAGPAGIVTAVILIPTFVAAIYVGLRLSLFTLLAADSGAFSLGRAWSLARGAMVVLLVAGGFAYFVEMGLGSGLGLIGGWVGRLTGQSSAPGVVSAIAQALNSAISAPLFVGLQLYVYNAQRGDGGIAATFA